jgi:predicted transcriptional regulator
VTDKAIIRVADVMEFNYISIDGLATVAEALEQMSEQSARFLIVNKRSDDDEFGMVLVSDIAKQVLARHRSPDRVNVYEIMSKPVLGVAPAMDIRYCARLFERFGISIAPVIDHGEIKGIVTYGGLVMKGLIKLADSS